MQLYYKETPTQVGFLVTFATFLRTNLFTEHLQCLLLGTGIHGNTKFLKKRCALYRDGRNHREAYFHGLKAFEKLEY